MEKFYKIRNDQVFKTIFGAYENRDLLKKLIEEVILEEVEIIDLLLPEQRKDKVWVKGKTLDVLVKTKEGEINIELNSCSEYFIRRRNASYIFKRYSNSINVGNSYQEMPKFIQINLTSGEYNSSLPLVAMYELYDKNNDRIFINNLKIYEINLREATNVCYNKDGFEILGMLDMNYA